MMWIRLERSAGPDAAYWPGRKWLSAIDAIVWPCTAGLGLWNVHAKVGIAGPTALALLALLALLRLNEAVRRNHRYRFTTLIVVRLLTGLVFFGIAVKVGLAVTSGIAR